MDDQQSSAPDAVWTAQTAVDDGLTVEYVLCRSDGGYSVQATVEETGETALVRDICDDPERARRIFDAVVLGGVTPCCIFEVIEDVLETLLWM